MTVLEAIRERRAVRDFRPGPVSAGTLHQLISAASWAPSAMNEQPWRFTIVADAALLDEISARAKSWLLADVSGLPRPDHFRDLLADPNFHLFYHAPVLLIVSAPAAARWAREDCALAAENLMLAAVSLGLGSCWIGFAQGWLNTQEARSLLGLPADCLAVAPIILGHPRTAQPAVARKAPIVAWIGRPSAHPGGGAPVGEGPDVTPAGSLADPPRGAGRS